MSAVFSFERPLSNEERKILWEKRLKNNRANTPLTLVKG